MASTASCQPGGKGPPGIAPGMGCGIADENSVRKRRVMHDRKG